MNVAVALYLGWKPHPPSRNTTARRIAAGTARLARPTALHTGGLTVTTTCGRSPPSVGRSPLVNARYASSTTASASRCAAERKSTSTSGLASQFGLHLCPLLGAEVRRHPRQYRADHRDIGSADRVVSHRRRLRQSRSHRCATQPTA